ncbi:MAG: hypothetical protein IPP55_16535 [Anaerolineales bacterium]|nr:hypothetical protein [Anaerolineales bacterium]
MDQCSLNDLPAVGTFPLQQVFLDLGKDLHGFIFVDHTATFATSDIEIEAVQASKRRLESETSLPFEGRKRRG